MANLHEVNAADYARFSKRAPPSGTGDYLVGEFGWHSECSKSFDQRQAMDVSFGTRAAARDHIAPEACEL